MGIVGGIGAWMISTAGNGQWASAVAKAMADKMGNGEPQQQTADNVENAQRTQRTAPGATTRADERRAPALLPSDAFERCATKALRGDYGPLEHWQQCAYIWGLAKRVRCCGLAKVTSYGPWESPHMSGGEWTASGLRVSARFCAANPEIAFGTIVWTEYGLRYVQDRGGWVKLGWVPRVGRVTTALENANLDYYSERELATLRETPWAVVRQADSY